MRIFLFVLPLLILVMPVFSSQKKAYHQKKVKSSKVKKGKHYVRYPVRVNLLVNSEKLKIQDLIRDLHE